jgi:hypothetical protein
MLDSKEILIVEVDTGDIEAIAPSASDPLPTCRFFSRPDADLQAPVEEAAELAEQRGGCQKWKNIDRLFVLFGCEILKVVPAVSLPRCRQL